MYTPLSGIPHRFTDGGGRCNQCILLFKGVNRWAGLCGVWVWVGVAGGVAWCAVSGLYIVIIEPIDLVQP